MKKRFVFLLVFFAIFFANAQSDSLKTINKKFNFQYKKLYIPTGMMVAGLLADVGGKESIENEVKEERNEHLLGFSNHFDDYAQFAPFVALYALEWAGMKPRTDWQNRTAILIKGQVLNLGLVYILKKMINETRPDGTAYSFPSGHTANAFAGATILSVEYGEEHKWIPYAAYGFASGIGIMRMLNNKHYISDVLFGAGLGILSIKTAYWTHQYKWNKKNNTQDPFEGVIYPKN